MGRNEAAIAAQHRLAAGRNQARAEDYLFMVAAGEHPENIARRLGLSPKALDDWIHRARRHGWLPRPEKEAA